MLFARLPCPLGFENGQLNGQEALWYPFCAESALDDAELKANR